jgi:protocatechuate 3,4-dioxygenase beta subunit
MRNTLRVVLCAVFCAAALLADSANVTLNGHVTDTAAGPLAGAIVTVTNDQDLPFSVETDARGAYSFGALKPGVYSIRVTLPGYAMFENQSLNVSSGHPRLVNVRLSGQMTVSAKR